MAKRELVRFEDIDGRDLMYKNFEGRAGTYNNEGDRNFCLRLNEDEFRQLQEAGYTSLKEKTRTDSDGEEYTIRYIPVKVNFNSKRPPQINKITKRGLVPLDEDTVKILDWADILSASVSISPYDWTRPDRSGRSAYLQELLVEIDDDTFASRYMNEHDEA